MAKRNFDYGLELTNNSKVGMAFSLPRSETCINATKLCKRLCYGDSIRYQSKGQKDKRSRNLRTVEFLLAEGGPELLAENLTMLVDQARPRDWLTARITGSKTTVPFSLRVHDVGDFYSIDYVRAWVLTAKNRPECRFWFYTRSFIGGEIFQALTELAKLPNCQGWLSIDSENFQDAILALCRAPRGVWKLALLQDRDLDKGVISALEEMENRVEVVNFPYHKSGRYIEPVSHELLTQCPAVVGNLALNTQRDVLRPCQACTFCLP